jgi:hypothetical protein
VSKREWELGKSPEKAEGCGRDLVRLLAVTTTYLVLIYPPEGL